MSLVYESEGKSVSLRAASMCGEEAAAEEEWWAPSAEGEEAELDD